MRVTGLDHLVLTVRDVEATVAFYARALGMVPVTFDGRRALAFGRQRINLHPAGGEYDPHARHPVPGSGDICLLTDVPLARVAEHLAREGVAVEMGPVDRTGAAGAL